MKFPMENVQMECQNEKVEKVKKKRKKVFYYIYFIKIIYQYVKIPRKHGVYFFTKKQKSLISTNRTSIVSQYFAEFMRMYIYNNKKLQKKYVR